MRVVGVFRKNWREQKRDLLLISLVIIFGPFFVFMYWFLFPGGSTTYGLLILNEDRSVQMQDGSILAAGEEMIREMKSLTYASGTPLLKILPVTNRTQANNLLRNRDASALIIIPPEFSSSLRAQKQKEQHVSSTVTFVGDLTNPYYTITAVLASTGIEQYIEKTTGQKGFIEIKEESLGSSSARTEFEIYVPGIFIFSLMVLMFLVAMNVAREVESGTLARMKLTCMTSLDFLAGMSLLQIVVGLSAVLLTFLTALACGFKSEGSLWLAVLVCILACVSVIGLGLVVAAFSRTVTQAFIIANFPFAFFAFFSGAVFPVPKIPVFTLFGHAVGLFDIMPSTHAVNALNKIFTMGMGVGEILYEIIFLVLLSALYFIVGVWSFKRRHLT
jgi:ABC-2 type transport system permease protein